MKCNNCGCEVTYRRRKEYPPGCLTDREAEVMALIVQGVSDNKEIAQILSITTSAVKFQVTGILKKLGLKGQRKHQILFLWHQGELDEGVIALVYRYLPRIGDGVQVPVKGEK